MQNPKSKIYLIGVDVGTGSARAGLFTTTGKMLTSAVEPIQTWKPRPDYVEQSSEDIWQAVCSAVQSCVSQSGIAPEDVAGISYDATCSLVVLDNSDKPLTVDLEGDPQRNIIVWMDHRALEETEAINAGGYDVLRYVGGRLSPEMETPKLKWLKTHLPQTWAQAGKFLDLADFLTYCSTGIDARSLCTVVCKWTYLGHEGASGRWDREFFQSIGLSDIFENGRVSDDVRPMGSPLGALTPESAADLGLTTNCMVGVGIIDAHAGGLGLLGAVFNTQPNDSKDGNRENTGKEQSPDPSALETALALIGGTSNCHMAVSRDAKYIDGIWGPYYGAMVPGLWLTEGGQSAAGSAIDHVIADHANAPALNVQAEAEGVTVYQLLNAHIARLQKTWNLPYPALLTRDLHVLPYFLGNRSPNADPYARGIIDGLTLDESLTSQTLRYYAALQAVAYGTRDIVRAMNETGYRIDTLFVTGGGTKNPLWLQEHADATGLTLILPEESEAVLLGSAILAATGAGVYPNILAAMQAMSRAGDIVRPNPDTAAYHEAKFNIFRLLYQEQKLRREYMSKF
jgi:FGGY-family pentulose kinase